MNTKNHILLKAVLNDGHYQTEDLLMVSCVDPTPTPTVSPTVTPTITPSRGYIAPSPPSPPPPSPTPSPSAISNIVLQSSNSWTYRYNDFLIIKFTPAANTDRNVSFSIPSLPSILLPQPGQPSPIPSSANVVYQNTLIGNLLFINSYISQNISMTMNNSNYSSVITIGQIAFI